MESSPPLSRYVSQNSKKRVFPGGSSNDAEVVEIAPPSNWSSNSKSSKQKLLIPHEIIDVDVDEDYSDSKLDVNVESNGKGKELLVNVSRSHGGSSNSGPVDGVQSSKKNFPSGSNGPNLVDDFGSDVIYGDDEHLDMYFDDLMYDDYAVLQSHFDTMDIPPGIEAPIPWMPGPVEGKMVSTTASTSGREGSMATRDQSASFSSSTPYSHRTQVESALLSMGPALGKKRSIATGSSNKISFKEGHDSMNLSLGAEKLKPSKGLGSSHSIGKFRSSGAKGSYSWWHNQATPAASNFPKFPVGFPGSDWMNLPINMTNTQVSPGFFHAPGAMNYFSQEMDLSPWKQGSLNSAPTAGSSSIPSISASGREHRGSVDDILKKHHDFKKFDTVQDHLDHHYSRQASPANQPPKNWAKKIQEEWKILEKDLPDTIFVRVYETRMDLLRAVIMGADGTPYHNGLFFFDVFFPRNYPNVPPHVYYHSFGLRLNPNLYACGKVCLSLLNTWSGSGKEKWIPGVSTMLQVLVSIQGLILNAKPYFNEPGFAGMSGSVRGEQSSLQYNESTYLLNVKTMVYSLRRPPKHFEDFVVGHFLHTAQDILVACKAYMDGAQVGSLVRGGVQDVDEGDKSCSQNFKASLAGFIKTLVDTFKEIGVKDCDKFLIMSQNPSGVVPVVPVKLGHFYG